MPFGGLGFGEMVLIFAVLLLLFGAKRLPELAGGMGKGIRDFKRALNGMDDSAVQNAISTPAAAGPAAQVTQGQQPAQPVETAVPAVEAKAE